jgi:peptidoglycan/xylan/chitin deacetylase (PgdA/CDA1 family)
MGEYGGGIVAVFPFDAGGMMLDYRVSSKSFYAPHLRLPHEQVSRISRGQIRKLVSRALEVLHHRRGLPYVHVWYYPGEALNVFSLRIDTDAASEEEIDSLFNVADKYQIPFSWFVHVKAQEGFLDRFMAMEGHEIGVHCYEHIRYRNTEDAARDIRRAMDLLGRAGIDPHGFSAPYGVWNPAVAKAIDSFRFEYSSEFSYDYDNLPSYPTGDDRTSSTLQMPIHPVSIGTLRRQGFTQEEMRQYLVGCVGRKLSGRDPMIFYHHPRNHHEQALEEMIGVVKQNDIPIVRMLDYARWWKKRNDFSMNIDVLESMMHIQAQPPGDEVRLHVTRNDGSEGFVPLQDSVHLQNVDWRKKPDPSPLPEDIHRIRKLNPWIFINRCEDYVSNILNPR